MYYLPLFGVVGTLYVVCKMRLLTRQDPGTRKDGKDCGHIADGAMLFKGRI